MSMKLPILTAATLVAVFAELLPAADPQLLNLVMPDAKVLAGVNVDQAKTSPLGQYLLTQAQTQDQHLQQIVTLTGFDPTRDIHELLFASTGAPGGPNGLALARGTFDAARIQALAQTAGATSEVYKDITILEDPKQTHGAAFLDGKLAVAGDIASVKGAIDRQTLAAPLPAAVIVQVNQWSSTEDAWVVVTVPPSSLHPPAGVPGAPAGAPAAMQNALQSIQQSAGGVKFGTQIVVTGQAQTDTAANATSLAGVGQFLVSLAQMQAQQKNPQLAAVLPSLTVTASGNSVNVSLSVPETVVEQAVKAGPKAAPQSIQRGTRRRL
ncbi:MAG: hypothetical protein LAP40_23010 [Acidobacteriia bacterium]|nr:hypothetical protein [Terriglobia bacterium]